jgi:hypothetical protein
MALVRTLFSLSHATDEPQGCSGYELFYNIRKVFTRAGAESRGRGPRRRCRVGAISKVLGCAGYPTSQLATGEEALAAALARRSRLVPDCG